MGLTRCSTGLGAVDCGLTVQRLAESDRVFALAGNPNVGKSTVFNRHYKLSKKPKARKQK